MRLHRNVWVTSATSFLTDVSSEMIFNLLPLFLANVLGLGTSFIGLIEGAAEALSSLLKIASGWLSDRLGARKWLAVLGYGISTAAKPFLYVASSGPAVLGVRLGDRLGKGVRTAPRDALLAASVDPSHRGLAFGLHRAGDTAGAFVGLAVAFGLVWWFQRDGVELEATTFRTLVLVSVVPAVLAVIVLAVGAREVTSGGKGERSPRLSLAGSDGTFRRFLVAIVIFTLGNSADAFLILRAQERGLSVLGVLGMLAGFNLVYALVSAPSGHLSDRLGRRVLIVGGWLLYAVLYLGFALSVAAWHVVVLFCLYGLYHGLVEGVARAFVADLVPEEERGTAFGLYHAAVGVAALPASVIAGVLWQGAGSFSGFGPKAPFFFGAAMAFVATAALLVWVRPES